MKLTLEQLREMVREVLKETALPNLQSEQSTRKPPTLRQSAAGIPIHLYAHTQQNGKIKYYIRSSLITRSKIPGGEKFDDYSLMSKKEILLWVKNILDALEEELDENT